MAHDASPKGLSIAFEGHFDRVNALVILADGRVASATFWRDISIWNSKNGSLDASLEGHNDIVTNLTLLLDKRLASASNDGTIRIWSIGSTWTRCDQILFGHAPSKVSNLVPSITCLVALGDGRRLVSGGGDDTVRVWVISSGDCEQTIKGEGASLLDDSARGSAITSLAEVPGLPDGVCRICCGAFFGRLRVYDLTRDGGVTPKVLEVLDNDGGGGGVVSVIAVLSGGRIATATATAWPIWHRQASCPLASDAEGGGGVSGGPASEGARSVHIWNTHTGEMEKELCGHLGAVWALLPLSDGRLVSGGERGELRIWNLDKKERVLEQTLDVFGDTVACVAQLANGEIVAGGLASALYVFNPATGARVRRLQGRAGGFGALAQLPDGRLVSGSAPFGSTTLAASVKVWTLCVWGSSERSAWGDAMAGADQERSCRDVHGGADMDEEQCKGGGCTVM